MNDDDQQALIASLEAQEEQLVFTRFSNADLAHLSPYGTSNLKRFGKFPTDLIPDPVPVERGLPS